MAWNTHDSQNWGTSDPLEPLVPKPHEFPFKNLGISDSLESVVPRNHLIPSADETTVSEIKTSIREDGRMKEEWIKQKEWKNNQGRRKKDRRGRRRMEESKGERKMEGGC